MADTQIQPLVHSAGLWISPQLCKAMPDSPTAVISPFLLSIQLFFLNYFVHYPFLTGANY